MYSYGQPYGGAQVGGTPQQGSLEGRKQALIKKLSGQNKGSGGAARLAGGVPFGAMPRLGFNPNARSVFAQGNEQFNFSGGPPGFQGAADGSAGSFTPPGQGGLPPGLGPAAGQGSGSPGVPQGGQSSYDPTGDAGTSHLLEKPPGQVPVPGSPSQLGVGGEQAQTGAVPIAVQNAVNGDGELSGGVQAWLQANPWFLGQMGIGGGAIL